MSTTGKRIKEIRTALGLSQEEFGSIFNSGKSYVSAVENDKSKLSVENLVKLLVNYKVNINYVLGEIGAPFIEETKNPLKEEILNEIYSTLREQGVIK